MFHKLLIFSFLLFSFSALCQVRSPRENMDHALFFAVANYDDVRLQKLPQTIENAEAIAQVLKDDYGFSVEIVKNPKLDDIESKLEEYRQRYTNGTFPRKGQLLVFFSGHGAKGFNNGFFLPADIDSRQVLSNSIVYNTWRPFISEINCQHILVAVDACYSVTFDPNWDMRGDRKDFHRPGELNEIERTLLNHEKFPARVFFTSDSREDVVPGKSNFAKKFLEGLTKSSSNATFLSSERLFAEYIDFAQPVPKMGTFEKDDPQSSFLFFPSSNVTENTALATPKNQQAVDIDAYKKAQEESTIESYEEYLSMFPSGIFQEQAKNQLRAINEKIAFKLATSAGSISAYEEFLRNYPDGLFFQEAQLVLRAVRQNEISNKEVINRDKEVIIGKVTNKNNGNPMPFVDVYVKGSMEIKTTADERGNFAIEVPKALKTFTLIFRECEHKAMKISLYKTFDKVKYRTKRGFCY